MGNQACCEDSRTQTTVLGDVHSSKSGVKPKPLEEEVLLIIGRREIL